MLKRIIDSVRSIDINIGLSWMSSAAMLVLSMMVSIGLLYLVNYSGQLLYDVDVLEILDTTNTPFIHAVSYLLGALFTFFEILLWKVMSHMCHIIIKKGQDSNAEKTSIHSNDR